MAASGVQGPHYETRSIFSFQKPKKELIFPFANFKVAYFLAMTQSIENPSRLKRSNDPHVVMLTPVIGHDQKCISNTFIN